MNHPQSAPRDGSIRGLEKLLDCQGARSLPSSNHTADRVPCLSTSKLDHAEHHRAEARSTFETTPRLMRKQHCCPSCFCFLAIRRSPPPPAGTAGTSPAHAAAPRAPKSERKRKDPAWTASSTGSQREYESYAELHPSLVATWCRGGEAYCWRSYRPRRKFYRREDTPWILLPLTQGYFPRQRIFQAKATSETRCLGINTASVC